MTATTFTAQLNDSATLMFVTLLHLTARSFEVQGFKALLTGTRMTVQTDSVGTMFTLPNTPANRALVEAALTRYMPGETGTGFDGKPRTIAVENTGVSAF